MSADATGGEAPKLIVDDDWKREAKAEKAKLAEQERAKQQEAAAEGGEGDPGPIKFDDLVKTLASQAMMYLGYMPDPQTGKAIVAPEYARLYIDLMGVLEEKTQGNLDEEETKMLTAMLSELRMAFVEVSKAVAMAVEEGKIQPNAMGGPGVGAVGGAPGVPPPPAGG